MNEEGRSNPEFDVREALSRAYLLVSWGHIDPALKLCERVDESFEGGHPLPQTLAGGFLVGAGRMREGLQRLRATVRRFPAAPMPHIQFAEACFLAGRHRQGHRAMERARGVLDEASEECRLWFDSLEAVWMSDDPPAVTSLPVGPI
jgi:predicted Zn-dependent protease